MTPHSEHLIDENIYPDGGQKWRPPVPRLFNNPDRDFSAGQSEDEIDADIAKLFACRPPGLDEFFADPIVQMRIGMLIAQAINEPTRPQRRHKSH